MISHPLFVLAVLGLNVALSEWLARHTALRHLGSALLVIVLTAITANVGLIPTVTDGSPVYDGIFSYLAPLAIFLLLLRVHLRTVLSAGGPMVVLFLAGSAGTMIGVLTGMHLVGGSEAFGELHHALGGMFVGTYTGGSINFNVIALEYGVVEDGTLYAAAAVVDSAMTTVWMACTVALPRLLAKFWPGRQRQDAGPAGTELITGVKEDTETVHPVDLAILLALASFSVWISQGASDLLEQRLGMHIPSMLILTSLALAGAQLEPIRRLKGTRLSGMLAVMLFLAVIGALCDFSALSHIGPLGLSLLIFVATVVAVHGIVIFGFAALFRLDPATAAVASQANIGGGTTALALARSLGRGELVLPGILVGTLGTALGTYLGFLTASWLG